MRFIAAFAIASGAYACVAVGSATPDAVALDLAREEARARLADGFRSLNAGRTTLLELADRLADMAATNSPAMQRVLQEGAFNIYREADNLKRAAERHVPFWINLGTDAEFEFAACPQRVFRTRRRRELADRAAQDCGGACPHEDGAFGAVAADIPQAHGIWRQLREGRARDGRCRCDGPSGEVSRHPHDRRVREDDWLNNDQSARQLCINSCISL